MAAAPAPRYLLETLVEKLRAAKFDLGVDVVLRMQALLEVIEEGEDRDQRVRSTFRSLVAKDPDEVARFDEIFDEIWNAPVVAPEPGKSQGEKSFGGLQLGWGVFAVLVAAGLLAFAWITFRPPPPSGGTGSTTGQTTGSSTTGGQVKPPTPTEIDIGPTGDLVTPAEPSMAPLVRNDPTPRSITLNIVAQPQPSLPTIQPDPPPTNLLTDWWPFVLALFGLLPLLFLGARKLREAQRRNQLRQEGGRKRPPFETSLRSTPPKVTPYSGRSFENAVVELSRSAPHRRQVIDEEATVQATSEAAGFFTLQERSAPGAPEYLLLIDRHGFRDQRASLANLLATRLRETGVLLDVFYYSGDPRYPTTPDGRPVTLAQLAEEYEDARLVLAGEGAELIDPETGEIAPWLAAFKAWPFRALLTPRSPADWGGREVVLSRFFEVLPATVEGLQELRHRSDIARPRGLFLPESARRTPQGSRTRDLEVLRGYLGPLGFRWLSFLALYPQAHWDLTMALGEKVDEEGRALADESVLLRLVRLPWFVEPKMPDDLRGRLVGTLSPSELRTAAAAIVELLSRNVPPQDSHAEDPYRLRVAYFEWLSKPDDKDAAGRFREVLRTPQGELLAADPVVRLLIHRRRLYGGVPAASRFFFRHGIPALGLKPIGQILCGLCFATMATAFSIATPSPESGKKGPWPKVSFHRDTLSFQKPEIDLKGVVSGAESLFALNIENESRQALLVKSVRLATTEDGAGAAQSLGGWSLSGPEDRSSVEKGKGLSASLSLKATGTVADVWLVAETDKGRLATHLKTAVLEKTKVHWEGDPGDKRFAKGGYDFGGATGDGFLRLMNDTKEEVAIDLSVLGDLDLFPISAEDGKPFTRSNDGKNPDEELSFRLPKGGSQRFKVTNNSKGNPKAGISLRADVDGTRVSAAVVAGGGVPRLVWSNNVVSFTRKEGDTTKLSDTVTLTNQGKDAVAVTVLFKGEGYSASYIKSGASVDDGGAFASVTGLIRNAVTAVQLNQAVSKKVEPGKSWQFSISFTATKSGKYPLQLIATPEGSTAKVVKNIIGTVTNAQTADIALIGPSAFNLGSEDPTYFAGAANDIINKVADTLKSDGYRVAVGANANAKLRVVVRQSNSLVFRGNLAVSFAQYYAAILSPSGTHAYASIQANPQSAADLDVAFSVSPFPKERLDRITRDASTLSSFLASYLSGKSLPEINPYAADDFGGDALLTSVQGLVQVSNGGKGLAAQVGNSLSADEGIVSGVGRAEVQVPANQTIVGMSPNTILMVPSPGSSDFILSRGAVRMLFQAGRLMTQLSLFTQNSGQASEISVVRAGGEDFAVVHLGRVSGESSVSQESKGSGPAMNAGSAFRVVSGKSEIVPVVLLNSAPGLPEALKRASQNYPPPFVTTTDLVGWLGLSAFNAKGQSDDLADGQVADFLLNWKPNPLLTVDLRAIRPSWPLTNTDYLASVVRNGKTYGLYSDGSVREIKPAGATPGAPKGSKPSAASSN